MYLEAAPKQFIPHTAINARADGTFAATVGLRGLAQAAEVKAELLDASGRVVGTALGRAAAADTLVQLRTQVARPLTWTAEKPRLYRARFTLQAADQPLYQTTETFGFRTIEVRRGKGIFVNGLSGSVPAPALPPGNFSFLDAIPPIGTKLALNVDNTTRNLGPLSEANHPGGAARRTLYFFGLPKTTGQPYVVPAKNDLF